MEAADIVGLEKTNESRQTKILLYYLERLFVPIFTESAYPVSKS